MIIAEAEKNNGRNCKRTATIEVKFLYWSMRRRMLRKRSRRRNRRPKQRKHKRWKIVGICRTTTLLPKRNFDNIVPF